MHLGNLLLWLTLATTLGPQGETAGWRAAPTHCVVEAVGDECQVTLNLHVPQSDDEGYCLFMGDTRISCDYLPGKVYDVVLRFSKKQQLTVRNATTGDIVYDVTLHIESLKPHRKRRRIKQPWSIF